MDAYAFIPALAEMKYTQNMLFELRLLQI